VSSEVNVSSQKFNIKLFVAEADGMTELWLRLESVCTVAVCELLYTPCPEKKSVQYFMRNFNLNIFSILLA